MVATLDQLERGSTARVSKVGGGGPFRRRLLELGVMPGVPIERTGQAPLGDPLQFRVRGAVLCLRRTEASEIEIGGPPDLRVPSEPAAPAEAVDAPAASPASCHSAPAPAGHGGPRIAVLGNPNSGKSTLFNALTGGYAPVGNYTGTTVERFQADRILPTSGVVRFVDVPGTWSLAARSPEERIAIDSALGLGHDPAPSLLLVLLDAPRIERSLYLALQLIELGVPVVVACNLMDEARAEGRAPDTAILAEQLGVPVVGISARTGEGIDELVGVIDRALVDRAVPPTPRIGWSASLERDVLEVAAAFPERIRAVVGDDPRRAKVLALWMLLSDESAGADLDVEVLRRVRARARDEGRDLVAEVVGARYAWIDARAPLFTRARASGPSLSERIDRVLLHPVAGTFGFLVVMALVFQALFAWSDPAIGLIEAVFAALGGAVGSGLDAVVAAAPLGGLAQIGRDLVVDGIIGGVGSVVVFVPQIALLFLFIAVLEDSGYLARAAHLMDRVLRLAGLPGKAFVPLLSGFACAVPAILATRTMPRLRDRLLTMAVVPLTSCSARLPVYGLVIGAVFPQFLPGTFIPARPAALFGMYLFSTVVTVAASIVLGRLVLPDQASAELIELPPYRMPHPYAVGRLVLSRVGSFLREAGGTILVATLVLWALMYFPRVETEDVLSADQIAAAEARGDLEQVAAAAALENSFAGRFGRTIEPAIAPLGFDWRIGIGLIGAFAAREVFVSTLGVAYGLGDEVDEGDVGLRARLQSERRADGSLLYTPLTGTSLMVFFALAMQCLSTLGVLRRESGGWRWPAFVVVYMTALAWLASFAVYQGGRALGFE